MSLYIVIIWPLDGRVEAILLTFQNLIIISDLSCSETIGLFTIIPAQSEEEAIEQGNVFLTFEFAKGKRGYSIFESAYDYAGPKLKMIDKIRKERIRTNEVILRQKLAACNGCVTRAAEELGIDRKTFYRGLREGSELRAMGE